MTPPVRTVAALAAGTLTFIATATGPASAAVWSHDDPRRDVVSVTPSGETQFAPAPTNHNTDITRFVVRHTKNRVALRLNLRDLTARTTFAWYRIVTDSGEYRAQQLLGKSPMLPFGAAAPEEGQTLYLSGPDGEIECPGATDAARRGKDRARISIPRSCLDQPAWVRGGAVAMTFDHVGQRILADSAMTEGITEASEEDDLLVLGRKVRRG